MYRLQGKVALVTGAARGIGAAIAVAFAAERASVIVTDINDESGERVAREIGGAALFRHLDVRDEPAWMATFAEIRQLFGRVDVLVNNAGITGFEETRGPHDPEHATLENWRKVHEVNLDGMFLGCKHAIAAMRSTGQGSIINISSRSGMVGQPTIPAYASSKAGVRNHTKSVALYCAQQGLNIRCNSIHPAAILTEMWDPLLGDGPDREAKLRAVIKDTPLRRWGTPQEVAALAVLLASDEAAYMTGSELTLDGGILAGSAGSPAER